MWFTLLRKCRSVSRCQDDAAMRSVVLIHQAAIEVRKLATTEFDSRASQQPGNAIQETWQRFCYCVLHLNKREKHKHRLKISSNRHWMDINAVEAFQLIKYQTVTIQGLASWGRPSVFAMSTHVNLALCLPVEVCRLVVLTASGSSLETQESTSRGLDAEPPAELSTARSWATSDSPSPIEHVVFHAYVLCWWFIWQ